MIGTLSKTKPVTSRPIFTLSLEFVEEIKNRLEKDGWNINGYFVISKLMKDTEGITIDGEYFPPTNNYKGYIAVQRKDGELFQCAISEYGEEIENADEEKLEALLREDYDNAIETLKEFQNCGCGPKKDCKLHSIGEQHAAN